MRTAESADEVRVEDGGRLHLPVPAGVADEQALSLARAGTTAWHLLRTCAHLRPDESIAGHDAVEAGPDGPDARLTRANEGEQVDVVLDSGGTLKASLDALAPFGRIVCYGVDQDESIKLTGLLGGSQSVIGLRFEHTLERPDMIARAVSELFGLTSAGRLRPVVATSTR